MCQEKRKPAKEEWLEEAERAYNEMFGPGGRRNKKPATFTELEDQACEVGERLTRWLLEKKISKEAGESSCEEEECPCPRCGKAAKRKEEGQEVRELRARPGPVAFDRQGYYCPSCRKVFFPS